MPVILAPFRERLRISVIGARPEQPGLLSVPGDALAAQIVQVGRERALRPP